MPPTHRPPGLAILLIGSMSALAVACSAPADDPPAGHDSPPTTTATQTSAPPSGSTPPRESLGPSPTMPAPGTRAAPDNTESSSAPGSVCESGASLIEDARWIDVDGQPSLEVTPTELMRQCGLAGLEEAAWAEVLTLAADADAPGMDAQLTCHIVFAPGKDVWHLEPWRPEVDAGELLRTRCNPGAPDPDLG